MKSNYNLTPTLTHSNNDLTLPLSRMAKPDTDHSKTPQHYPLPPTLAVTLALPCEASPTQYAGEVEVFSSQWHPARNWSTSQVYLSNAIPFTSTTFVYNITVPYSTLYVHFIPSALLVHPTSSTITISAPATTTFPEQHQAVYFETLYARSVGLTEGEFRETSLKVTNQDSTNSSTYHVGIFRAPSSDATISDFMMTTDEDWEATQRPPPSA